MDPSGRRRGSGGEPDGGGGPVLSFDIEPTGTRRWRPFRPVLRDLGVAFPDERDPEGPRHA